MVEYLDEPGAERSDPTELLLDYLDWYRSVIARKLDGLSVEQLHTAYLPSGWTPLQLLKHLVYMERRWLVWGFRAEPVPDPAGDEDADGRWATGPLDTRENLVARLHAGGVRTRAVVSGAALTDRGAVGGRFTGEKTVPALSWILLHVLQEYARHAGHLDAVRELADGAVGE